MKWQDAIDEELVSLRIKEVFIPVTHIPDEKKPLGYKCILSWTDGVTRKKDKIKVGPTIFE